MNVPRISGERARTAAEFDPIQLNVPAKEGSVLAAIAIVERFRNLRRENGMREEKVKGELRQNAHGNATTGDDRFAVRLCRA